MRMSGCAEAVVCRENQPSHNASRPAAAATTLEFGRFCVLLRQRRLVAEGVPIELGTRAFDLLLALLEANGSLVTKEELFSRVWPGIVVAEENLKVQISALRKALGDDRDFIRTETGRGYRLTVAVKSTAGWSVDQRATRRRERSRQGTVRQSTRISAFPELFDPTAGLSAIAKSRLCKGLAFAVGLVLSTLSHPVHAAPASGSDIVQSLYDALLSTMKNGRTLGQSGRFAQLAPVIRQTFDVGLMARLSVGPTWTSLSEAQRREVSESIGRYMSAIYADRFDSYAGQKLEVTGEQPAPSGVMVKSRIIKANGEPVKIDYMMHRNGDDWLISDIYLDSAISEVATRRSEFSAILKNDGIDGLIAALNRKADILTGTTAKSF
jgi:phospholipid transport system substrate-binding protein